MEGSYINKRVCLEVLEGCMECCHDYDEGVAYICSIYDCLTTEEYTAVYNCWTSLNGRDL